MDHASSGSLITSCSRVSFKSFFSFSSASIDLILSAVNTSSRSRTAFICAIRDNTTTRSRRHQPIHSTSIKTSEGSLGEANRTHVSSRETAKSIAKALHQPKRCISQIHEVHDAFVTPKKHAQTHSMPPSHGPARTVPYSQTRIMKATRAHPYTVSKNTKPQPPSSSFP